jgi:hypothetical protein
MVIRRVPTTEHWRGLSPAGPVSQVFASTSPPIMLIRSRSDRTRPHHEDGTNTQPGLSAFDVQLALVVAPFASGSFIRDERHQSTS